MEIDDQRRAKEAEEARKALVKQRAEERRRQEEEEDERARKQLEEEAERKARERMRMHSFLRFIPSAPITTVVNLSPAVTSASNSEPVPRASDRLSAVKDQLKRDSSPSVRSSSVGRLVGRLDPSTAPKLEFGKGEPERKKELYGFDAELRDKIEANWDTEGEKMALTWISSMTGDEIPAGVGLYSALKNGVLLCKIINKVRPNIVPNVNYQPFNGLFERENIQQYLNACAKLGMPGPDLFIVPDLHDQKYLPAVLHNILALAKLYDARVVDKPAATTEHAKKLAAHSGHKRALSNCEGPKPWELEQQLKEKAHERASVALERHRSASAMPEQRRGRVESRPKLRSETRRQSYKPKERKKIVAGLNRDTPVEKLLGIVAMKLAFNKSDLHADLELLKKASIQTAGDLYDVFDDIEEWAGLKLPLLVKIELEELLPDVEVPDVNKVSKKEDKTNDITPLLPTSQPARPGTPSKDRPRARDMAEVPAEKNRGCTCSVM